MRYEHNNEVYYDGGSDIWEEVLGETWESYVDTVVKLYEYERSKKEIVDRNDILRPWFNTLCRPDGVNLTPEGLSKFYSMRDGLYCRMLAYEMGKEEILKCREHVAKYLFEQQEYQFVISHAKRSDGPTYALDHGAGMCHTSLGLLGVGFNVTVYDYDTPHKQAFLKALGKYGKDRGYVVEAIRFYDAAKYRVDECGQFDLIISQDVLEHVENPVDEVTRLHRALREGGLLLMGTFFNSCNGHDPQHLCEHDRFQDTSLWFSTVESIGLTPIFQDKNGVNKVWRKN